MGVSSCHDVHLDYRSECAKITGVVRIMCRIARPGDGDNAFKSLPHTIKVFSIRAS